MKRINSITLVNTAYKNKEFLEEINTAYIPWENNSMENAFLDCSNLINVYQLNQNVTNMCNAFSNCINLENVESIPSSVTNMMYTFSNCSKLLNIPEIPNSVETMYGTFKNCSSLEGDIIIPNSVKDLSFCFENCSSLLNTPIFNGDSDLLTMESSFDSSNIQISPDLSNCSNLIGMRKAFYNCQNLVGIPMIPNSVKDLSYTFSFCNNFQGKSNDALITEINYYGYNCINDDTEITPILSFSELINIDAGMELYLTDYYGTLTDEYKKNYKEDSSYIKYYVVRNYGESKYGIIEESKIINFDTFEVENEEEIINYTIEKNNEYDFIYIIRTIISDDKTINIPSNVTNMEHTFSRCSNLEAFPNFDNAINVSSLTGCFRECSNLQGIPNLSNCIKVMNVDGTFYNCKSIEDGIEKSFYGWKDNDNNTFFATNVEGIENNIDLYNVKEMIVGEDLYAYSNELDEFLVYYIKNEEPEVGDNVYIFNDNILTEYDTIKNISFNDANEYVLGFNINADINAVRKSSQDKRKEYNYDINTKTNLLIINSLYDEENDLYNITYINRDDDTVEYNLSLRRFVNIDNVLIVYGQIILPNNVTSMKETFYGCNIIGMPVIPNSVTTMYRAFENCEYLRDLRIIPDSVTNISYSFTHCNMIEGDVYINSAVITDAMNCFDGTSLQKNVYIPFTFENGVNTLTYNSFIDAGYSTDIRKDGVLLMNIDGDDIDLSDYDYNMDDITKDVELYNYKNTVNSNIKTPNINPIG